MYNYSRYYFAQTFKVSAQLHTDISNLANSVYNACIWTHT